MAFFVCHAKLLQRLPDGFGRHTEPGGTLVLVGVGVLAHVLCQFLKVNPEPGSRR